MAELSIRQATPEDCPTIVNLIGQLAEYEHLENDCIASPELLNKSLFSEKPDCYCVLAFEKQPDGSELAVGFALYFFNYSTFLTKRGLYLEDLFVIEKYRKRGYGKQIMKFLAKTAMEKNCGRFEWSVLDWNQPAINFYQSIGAKVMPDWRICRLTEDGIKKFSSDD